MCVDRVLNEITRILKLNFEPVVKRFIVVNCVGIVVLEEKSQKGRKKGRENLFQF